MVYHDDDDLTSARPAMRITSSQGGEVILQLVDRCIVQCILKTKGVWKYSRPCHRYKDAVL